MCISPSEPELEGKNGMECKTFAELYEFQCNVFEPKTADFSTKELMVLLKKLLNNFPHTDIEGGNRKPYSPTMDESVIWFKCYDHIITLISIKRDESKSNRTFWISIAAILVSLASAIAQLSELAN